MLDYDSQAEYIMQKQKISFGGIPNGIRIQKELWMKKEIEYLMQKYL